jgi:beta-glucuronidase
MTELRFAGKAHRILFALLVLTLAAGLPGLAAAQPTLQTLLVGVDRRSVTSLDGDWHYLVDQSKAE